MRITLRREWVRVPQQPTDDGETQAARYEVRGVCVPVVVDPVI